MKPAQAQKKEAGGERDSPDIFEPLISAVTETFFITQSIVCVCVCA